MTKVLNFIREWALIIAMVAGVAGYFAYVNLPLLDTTHGIAFKTIELLQPVLIFLMLFFTFCKVDIKDLKFRPWHLYLLLIQCGLFAGIGVLLMGMPASGLRIVLEGAMICLICPTATAAAVITRKLGGDVSGITCYTILINLAAAALISTMLPYVHPNPDISVMKATLMIVSKVFPLLLLPLITAVLVRYLIPPLHRTLLRYQDAPFYLWIVALALAMVVTTRSIMHSTVPLATQGGLVVVSLICCLFQFWAGRKLGIRWDDKITGGQALGQKNTVLAIWLGYTFFTPITAMVGGFYSVWHNLVNSYQLHKEHKKANRDINS